MKNWIFVFVFASLFFIEMDRVLARTIDSIPLPLVNQSMSKHFLDSLLNKRSADSILSASHLPVNQKLIQARKISFSGYLFFICVFLFAFLVFVKINYAKEFSELFLVVSNMGLNQQLYRELAGSISVPVLMMNLFSLSIITLYFFQLEKLYLINVSLSNWEMIGAIATLVCSVFIFRFLLIRFLRIIFPFRKEVSFYYFTESQIFRLIGLVLFPVVLLLAFGTPKIAELTQYLSFCLLAVFFIFRLSRGFVIGKEFFSNSKFHFLLYICTLEIAPFVILIKIFLRSSL